MFAGIETCLELTVPFTKYFSGRLRLKIKFDKYPDYVVETEKEVYIEHDSLITFVETDKPVYKPGQDVNIRILTLKHDLKPWKKMVHCTSACNIKMPREIYKYIKLLVYKFEIINIIIDNMNNNKYSIHILFIYS